MNVFFFAVSVVLLSVTAPFSKATDDEAQELPRPYAEAIERLNLYRQTSGLAKLQYDPALEAMGQAHARYFVRACELGYDATGHQESRAFDFYTPDGDEAARTSGLSYGNDAPLEALEGLLAAPFHRSQFIDQDITRVGIGHLISTTDDKCGITLFVTRPPAGGAIRTAAATGQKPRLTIFPADGMDEIPRFFPKERPDPRPHGTVVPTGYPITVMFNSRADARTVKKVAARLFDSNGQEVATWVTSRENPSISEDRIPWFIYSPAESQQAIKDAYALNFSSIFILPKHPLERNSTYTAEVAFDLSDGPQQLKWTFKTRTPRTWNVSPTEPEQLAVALSKADDGDTVRFESGTHILRRHSHHVAKRLVFEGPHDLSAKVVLDGAIIQVNDRSELVVRNLAVDGVNRSFLLFDASNTKFENTRITSRGEKSFFQVTDGSALAIHDSKAAAEGRLIDVYDQGALATRDLILEGNQTAFSFHDDSRGTIERTTLSSNGTKTPLQVADRSIVMLRDSKISAEAFAASVFGTARLTVERSSLRSTKNRKAIYVEPGAEFSVSSDEGPPLPKL